MMLDNNQIRSYKENGFLIMENIIPKDEIDFFNNKIKNFNNHKDSSNIICEKKGGIRSIFAPEIQEPEFINLIKNESLLLSSKQLVEDSLYLYQYKLNIKEAFIGEHWEWHQDFPFWHHEDNIETPNMISLMILLDDVASYQGPLLLIPKSHKDGIVQFNEKKHLENSKNIEDSLNSDLKYTVDNSLVKKLAIKNGITPFEAKKGSVLFFHPNIYHASNVNISPFERITAIITYNSINNIPQKTSFRPDYICYKNYKPLI